MIYYHASTNTSLRPRYEDEKTNASYKVHLWLITTDEQVLIQHINSSKKDLFIEDLTITSPSLSGALKEMEKKWGILCSAKDLIHAYTFTGRIEGYFLQIDLTCSFINIITERFNGSFIPLSEFKKLLTSRIPGKEAKQSINSLLKSFDAQNNWAY